MIVIPAIVKCDEYDCEAKGEVMLKLTFSDEHNIPDLSETLPEGWGYQGVLWNNVRGEHFCPEHARKY